MKTQIKTYFLFFLRTHRIQYLFTLAEILLQYITVYIKGQLYLLQTENRLQIRKQALISLKEDLEIYLGREDDNQK